MAEERFSTGIDRLDDMLGGGLLKGVNILVKGGTGTGKTTLALQYLMEGARLGERSMYLTFEESATQIKRFAKKFFPEIDSHIEDGVIQIVDFSPHAGIHKKVHIVEGEKVEVPDKEVLDSVDYIEDRIRDIKGQTIQRVVIDGLQTFALTFYDLSGKKDVEEVRKILSAILVMLKEQGITTYILSEEVDDQSNNLQFVNFTVDGVFVLKVNETLNMRTLRIAKMRGIKHPLTNVGIELTEGAGVTIPEG